MEDDIVVTKMNELMDQETASIWVRIGSGRHNSVVVGGLYTGNTASWDSSHRLPHGWKKKNEQEYRWRLMIEKWKTAAN